MNETQNGVTPGSPTDSPAGAYGPLPTSNPPGVELVMGNTDTSLYHCDPWVLDYLDRELQYPTAVAAKLEAAAQNEYSNYKPPGGGWDGWIRLLKKPRTRPPSFPSGLVPTVIRLLTKMGVQHALTDARERPVDGFPEHPKEPLIDRDYQLEAKGRCLEIGRGVLNMKPRSGKTRTVMAVVSSLGLGTVWIVPTDAIATQTLDAFKRFFGDNYAVHQKGAKDVSTAPVVICTAATAVRLGPEFYQTREVLVVDEWHHGAAKTYREIAALCDHIYYRFGMTGTFFRSGHDDMAMHALISNEIFYIGSEELLSRGYLVPTNVLYVPVDSPRLQVPGDTDRVVMPQLKYGIEEHDYRNQLAAYSAVYLERVGRKVLVLVRTKEQGKRIQRMISMQLGEKADGAEFEPCEFVSTNRHRAVQRRILKAFNTSDEVRVLIGTSLVGEGVDLPPADALVYARGEKAEVSLSQNAYRVITAIEGKRDAIIVDFADRHNAKLLKHSKQRLQTFHADPVFSVEVLPSIKFFGNWLRQYQNRAPRH